MAGAPDMIRFALAPQRAMFALELIDPIRGGPVGTGLRVAAAGLAPPALTPSNRFVWLDRGPPEERRIRIEAVSVDGRFAPFEDMLRVPAHEEGVKAAALLFRRRLRPTGLYEPPTGMIAVGGMLVEDDGSPAVAVAGARIRIQFRYAEDLETFSGCTAVSDPKGRFIAVVRRLGDVRPDPDRQFPGTFRAWLRLKRGGEVRVSPLFSLRLGRLTRMAAPLKWAELGRREIDEDA